ncbi:MAG: DUF2249 domain-containing protein [Deltaproteobacteria bacterium]|nr:DUF2249 domain-containing protein [Deltaproteobacteria bacterium]
MSDIINSRKIITVDCRELEPPEPMIKVLEAVHHMGDDEAVMMVHRKRPRLLFPRLDELGLKHEIREERENRIKILIWREN